MNSIDLLNTTFGGETLSPFADRLEPRLTPFGRLNLLAVAIRMAPRDEGLVLMSAAIRDLTYGRPLPPLLNVADEARHWASLATLIERKNYAAAIFNTFSANERIAFLGYAGRRAA